MAAEEVPPADGLSFLTKAQVERIDVRLASLSAYATQSGSGVHLTLIINGNGRLIGFGTPMLIEKIEPK